MTAESELRWYVVFSKPQSEARAKFNLDQQGYTTFYPYELRTFQGAQRQFKMRRPCFSRYLFAGVNDALSVYPIDNTFGVTRVLRLNGVPFQIPYSVVAALKERAAPDGLMPELPPAVALRHRVGDKVRIISGPFEDFIGEISRVDDSHEIQIFVELFGRRTDVTVPVRSVSGPSLLAVR